MTMKRFLCFVMSWVAMFLLAVVPAVRTVYGQTVTAEPAPAKLAKIPVIQWPRSFFLDSGNALVFQPQVESWNDQAKIVAWSAVSYQQANATGKPALGTIEIEATTRVALAERIVSLTPIRITEVNFPTLAREQAQTLSRELQSSFSTDERTIELDRVLAAVDKS